MNNIVLKIIKRYFYYSSSGRRWQRWYRTLTRLSAKVKNAAAAACTYYIFCDPALCSLSWPLAAALCRPTPPPPQRYYTFASPRRRRRPRVCVSVPLRRCSSMPLPPSVSSRRPSVRDRKAVDGRAGEETHAQPSGRPRGLRGKRPPLTRGNENKNHLISRSRDVFSRFTLHEMYIHNIIIICIFKYNGELATIYIIVLFKCFRALSYYCNEKKKREKEKKEKIRLLVKLPYKQF